MNIKRTFLKNTNKKIAIICTGYRDEIPLDELFEAVKSEGGLVVDEAGEPWSGLLCGAQGSAVMEVINVGKNVGLTVSWYKMDRTGRYETVAYVS